MYPVASRCERYSGTGTPLPASQHKKMEGSSAAINDHGERIAVEMWQLLERNIEELARTHSASFPVSLLTHFILRVHPFVGDSVVTREPRVIAVARRFHLERGRRCRSDRRSSRMLWHRRPRCGEIFPAGPGLSEWSTRGGTSHTEVGK